MRGQSLAIHRASSEPKEDDLFNGKIDPPVNKDEIINAVKGLLFARVEGAFKP